MTPELEDLFEFLRFSSISTDSNYTDDTRACADWLIAKLNGMGLSAELHETARHPIVIAHFLALGEQRPFERSWVLKARELVKRGDRDRRMLISRRHRSR